VRRAARSDIGDGRQGRVRIGAVAGGCASVGHVPRAPAVVPPRPATCRVRSAPRSAFGRRRAVLVAAALGDSASTGLVVAALVAAVVGASTSAGGAATAAVAIWAAEDGFVLHRFAELGFARPDLLALTVVVAAGAAAAGMSALRRRISAGAQPQPLDRRSATARIAALAPTSHAAG